MHHPTDRISTYHNLCFTIRGALAGTRNSLMGPPYEKKDYYYYYCDDEHNDDDDNNNSNYDYVILFIYYTLT